MIKASDIAKVNTVLQIFCPISAPIDGDNRDAQAMNRGAGMNLVSV